MYEGVYAVLGRRRARILREEMREGSDMFAVHAYLPAEASFGFMHEMRQRSSGGAAASLLLSHWERLQVRCGAQVRRVQTRQAEQAQVAHACYGEQKCRKQAEYL